MIVAGCVGFVGYVVGFAAGTEDMKRRIFNGEIEDDEAEAFARLMHPVGANHLIAER